MPTSPPKPCFKCHKLHMEQGSYCESCTPAPQPENRDNAYRRGYDGKWRGARLRFLSLYPFCEMCMKEGKVTIAEVVDHIIPHKGNKGLFWDITNWQSLCTKHHNEKTAAGL